MSTIVPYIHILGPEANGKHVLCIRPTVQHGQDRALSAKVVYKQAEEAIDHKRLCHSLKVYGLANFFFPSMTSFSICFAFSLPYLVDIAKCINVKGGIERDKRHP